MPPHPLRRKALARWARTDPTLHALAKRTPAPERALAGGTPFEALVESIAHQQVSIHAGRSIFARVRALGCTPAGLVAAGPDALRAAGLSRPKASYVLDLAQKAASGELDLDALAELPDEEVVAQLTRVKGIGVWTAKMFLLFHLDRPDVLPHEDLGLQLAVSDAYGVPREKAAKTMLRLAPAWSPYASYAALVLWNARRVAMEERPR